MSVALLSPVPRQTAFEVGKASPGALLYTWAAGEVGVIPQPTFTDGALVVPNTNPVVADASGLFGPVYLSRCVNYDIEMKNAAGVLVWSQPNVATGAVAGQPGSGSGFLGLEAFIG